MADVFALLWIIQILGTVAAGLTTVLSDAAGDGAFWMVWEFDG